MKKILGYVRSYFIHTDKRVWLLSAMCVAVGIFLNYHYLLNAWINEKANAIQYLYWYFVFLTAFSIPYFLYELFGMHRPFRQKQFIFLLLMAPLIFSWKMVFDLTIPFPFSAGENRYWNQVIYWPFKLIVITTVLYLLWQFTEENPDSFYGTSFKNFSARPYLLMLLVMIPLVAAASTQHDFLAMYPKLKNISFLKAQHHGWYKLLYELSYGSDFFSIELFFRGFLVLAFVKWFGADAILPM